MSTDTYAQFPAPLGILPGVSKNGAITALLLPNQRLALRCEAQAAATPELVALGNWLERYFLGENPDIDFPVSPKGTAFQRRVWSLLRTIPCGESITYGQLAKQLGPSMSSQAVGQAVGKNPIPIVIPCHRVLGAGGKLTGYAGGIPAKIRLLELENIPYR